MSGSPKGGGYTYINLAYPGKRYSHGNSFREKDMGNLVMMIFMCGEYFRGKDIELIADSHFGHIAPVAFLRIWNVYSTCSFLTSRRGLSNLPILSRKKLSDQEIDQLALREEKVEVDANSIAVPVPKKKKPKSNLDYFENKFSETQKGSYKVWRTDLPIADHQNFPIYLHAIHDSKIVYRISSKYAALPTVNLRITRKDANSGEKVKVDTPTSPAHHCFRNFMGFNDQSDSKRSRINLSRKYFRRWPQKLVAKTLEDAVINSFCNYLLDENCPSDESWPTYLHWLVQELLDSGENLRRRKIGQETPSRRYRKRKLPISQRPISGSDDTLLIGMNCKRGLHIGSIKQVPANERTKMCKFCGRQKAKFKCRSCQMYLCMDTPKPSPTGIHYRSTQPSCYLRFHGVSSFPRY